MSESNQKNKLVIKKVLFTENDLMRIIPILILFVIGWGKVPNHYILIAIIFLVLYLISPFKRLFDRNPQIILDKSGIHNLQTKITYSWEYVQDVDIEQRSSGTFKLAFKYKNPIIVLDLEKLRTSPKEIEDFIKTIDSNKLKEDDKELHNILDKNLENNQDLLIISNILRKYRRQYGWIVVLTFFGLLALSITIQVKYPFPYSFAIGWSLIWIILVYYNRSSELRLRESEHFRKLTEKQFNELMIRFSLRQQNDKRKKKIGYIAMFVISSLIFVASYFLIK